MLCMKKTILAITLLISFISFSQVKKTEPPNWWAGMQLKQLQIMFYGDNISEYTIETSPEITILNVLKTENPNYVFVTISTQDLKPGDYQFSFQKKGKTAFFKTYIIKERDAGSARREGFNSSDLIYLLMPDRFANGDKNNDSNKDLSEKADRNNKGGRHGGDIKGITDHLDYLQDLGVTTVWSTPLCEDNDPKYSYHGYAQSDVYNIDPRYGTNEDYKNLADKLHQKDMKLVMDYVTNHWGAEHWMIKDLPTYDWIHQFPGYANSNYRMTTQYDPHTSAIDKKYCEEGWFVPSMPDLNQSNPLVLNYLIQNAIWWIEYAGLDGLRVDTYSYNDKEGIAKWTQAIMQEYPHFNIVGEVWLHDQAQISYWQKDSKIGQIQSYNSHLPSVMDFTLHDAISVMFDEQASWDGGMMKAYENFVNDFLYSATDNLLVFTENHDTQRINTQLKGDFNNYKLATTLIATTRGIPQIYYGSEIGMQGDKANGDGDIRQDFPGGWEADKQNAFKAESRTDEQAAYYDFTKMLFNWRKNSPVIHTGKLTQYIPENNVYVYFRYNESKTVMVILNNNTEDQTIDMTRFSENLKGRTTGNEILTKAVVSWQKTLKIPAKTPFILEL